MSVLDAICSHCDFHCIRELNLGNLNEALIHFKGTEKYSKLLERYVFDENGVSEVLCDELAELLVQGKAMYSKNDNSIFLTYTLEQIDEVYNSIDSETARTVNSLLLDYRLYNTEKTKVKEKSLV